MKMTQVTKILLLAGQLAWGGAADALYLATDWASIRTNQDTCTQEARSALAVSGLTTGLSISGDSVFGTDEEYVASVRCLADDNVLFISVAGPEGQKARGYADAIRKAYLGIK